MKLLFTLFIFALTSVSFAVETGSEAPNFTLPAASAKDKKVSLSDFRGKKIVVLEWLNHGCPFVKKHYGPGNMQALQKKYVDKGVVWFSIASSAPGKQGFVTDVEALSEKKDHQSNATEILLDPEGKVGKSFEAKTTPHMFVIDKKGIVVYQGAIDDRPDTDPVSIAGAKNYVTSALDETLAGKKVSHGTTKAYGCSVKYAE